LLGALTEGLTAYFTDCLLHDEGLTNFVDAYANQKNDAIKLVKAFGLDVIANFNFKYGIVADLSPISHPRMCRVDCSCEPGWLGAATGRGAEPSA
jgi:hypothetical protein